MPDEDVPVERHRVESFDNDDAPPLAGTSTDADATPRTTREPTGSRRRAARCASGGRAPRARRAARAGSTTTRRRQRRRAADDRSRTAAAAAVRPRASRLLLALAIAGAVVYLRRFPTPSRARSTTCGRQVQDRRDRLLGAADLGDAAAVLNVGNRNLLDLLLLEVTVYEARTGLKLGSASSNALTISPFSSTTVSVNVLGSARTRRSPSKNGSLDLREEVAAAHVRRHRHLAAAVQGEQASSVTSNASGASTSSMYKEPWTQRAPAAADDASKVHDVPV